MATKIVGLDLGTHTVKVCELVTTFRKFELVGFGSEPVEAPIQARASFEEMAKAAQLLLTRRGLLGETLMAAIPAGLVSTVSLEFPFSQRKKLEAVLPFQLDEVIPFDVEDVVWDYQIIQKREDGGVTLLVSFVKEVILKELLEALNAEGIDPKVLSIGALSFFNLYDHLLEDETQAVAILDIGHHHSELVLFAGGQPVSVRDIAGGGAELTRALAGVFQVEMEQAEQGKLSEGRFGLPPFRSEEQRQELILRACYEGMTGILRELRRTLAAHELEGAKPIERLYLTGGGSQLEGLCEGLQESLTLPVQLLDPLKNGFNRLAGESDRLRPYIPKALALSLRAFHPAHQSQINFRKGEYIYTGDFGFMRGRLISLAFSMVIILILGAMVAVSKKRVLEAEYQSLNQRVLILSEPILGYETDDVEMLYNTVVSGGKEHTAASIPEKSAFNILAELSEQIDYNLEVEFDQFEMDLERKVLNLRGKTKSGGDVERLVDAIRSTKCFSRISKERVEKSVDDRTKFRLKASSTCG